jgi:hypothetical protein
LCIKLVDRHGPGFNSVLRSGIVAMFIAAARRTPVPWIHWAFSGGIETEPTPMLDTRRRMTKSSPAATARLQTRLANLMEAHGRRTGIDAGLTGRLSSLESRRARAALHFLQMGPWPLSGTAVEETRLEMVLSMLRCPLSRRFNATRLGSNVFGIPGAY